MLNSYLIFVIFIIIVYVIIGNYIYFTKVLPGIGTPVKLSGLKEFDHIALYLQIIEEKNEDPPWFFFYLKNMKKIAVILFFLLIPILMKS